ncbi:MAG: dihydroorotate dehydrogenase-like protein [Deltaproteobacteria bacterium]|nr:MAG: dihydroorotate dehydrogenase-like protein [Deltaproteobacteria bacterium]TMB29795.1 MAG: dihydroorotate dehydrogenase-like protein [Deltaproteobacteria bacterium]
MEKAPMDLAISYLGLRLDSPLVVGASPLADDLDDVRRLEDAGASCIVLRSLFEEQITREKYGTVYSLEIGDPADTEIISCFPKVHEFVLGPDEYLEHIRRIKETVGIPVIGSLNGINVGRWLEYGNLIEAAGADALELNVFFLATDPHETPIAVEKRTTDLARALKRRLHIPLAVKLSPFYSSLIHLARELEASGVDGLVLFNRFYQPLAGARSGPAAAPVRLSDSSELPLRLRFSKILSGTLKGADLAVSGGVHTSVDVIRSVIAGASAVQVVSALLENGPQYLRVLREGMESLLARKGYRSLDELKASLCADPFPDPQAHSRASYMQLLQRWSA